MSQLLFPKYLQASPPTKSVSMDNFSRVDATAGVAESQELNGVNSSSVDLSSSNYSPKTGGVSLFHERERQSDSCEGKEDIEKDDKRIQEFAPGGNTIVIPQLRNTIDVSRGRQ